MRLVDTFRKIFSPTDKPQENTHGGTPAKGQLSAMGPRDDYKGLHELLTGEKIDNASAKPSAEPR